MSKWKSIWENRSDHLDSLEVSDDRAVFAELKRVDGFDLEGGIPMESLMKQYTDLKKNLCLQEQCIRGWMRSRGKSLFACQRRICGGRA